MMTKQTSFFWFCFHCLAALPCMASNQAVAPMVDFWDHALRTTIVGGPNNSPEAEILARRQPGFDNKLLQLDFENAKVGSFSLAPARPGPLSLIPNLWRSELQIGQDAEIEFFLRAQDPGKQPPAEMEVELTAEDPSVLRFPVSASPSDDGWVRYTGRIGNVVPLPIATVRLLLPPDALFLIDGVIFREKAGDVVGLTDRTPEDWANEASTTRGQRAQTAIAAGAESDFGDELRGLIDQLWLGDDPARGNIRLRAILEEELAAIKAERSDLWSLTMNLRLIQLYFEFGLQSGTPRLEPETQRLLLETLWQRLEHKNDIGWARSNPWWMTGSENHDLNAKVSCLLSSRIFAGEPGYADRIYPNKGGTPGFGYWFHQSHGGSAGYGPNPPAPWGPATQSLTPADHYREWIQHFHRYIAARASHGFFLENASNTYQKWTLGFLLALHKYCGDPSLHGQLTSFFDIVWADWAQEQISGLRGGPKTRHHHSVGGYDSMTDMARFYLGGPGTSFHTYSTMLFGDYAFPDAVFELVLDTRGRGSYEIIKRGIGEEETIRPRPEGLERTLLAAPESRLLKYSWVTPSFILGTQMDHPDAIHGHLSATGRWHGLIIAGSPATRIVPTAGRYDASHYKKRGHDLEAMWQTAQHRNVLVGQQARRWHQISPAWFPANPVFQKPVEIHVGTGWDEQREEGGWLFLRKGGAYAALREVLPRKAAEATGRLALRPDTSPPDSPEQVEVDSPAPVWNEQKDAIVLQDKFSPFIIHAGDKETHGSFDAFRKSVLDSRLELLKTVVPGFYSLRYESTEDGSKAIDFPASTPEIPRIGGRPVNYLPQALFESPFLNSDFGSGRIQIGSGASSLTREFPKP